MEPNFVEQEFYRYIDESTVEKLRRSQMVMCPRQVDKLPMSLHDGTMPLTLHGH
jgi:hypothetical protein